MQAARPDFEISIIGINVIGDEAYNSLVTSTRRLPWLQDTEMTAVRSRWQASWRDVRIVDARNQLRAVFNLLNNDLADPTARATLKQMFLDAATAADSDKDGLADDWELIHFGNLTARATDDPDDDGMDNFSEFSFGTNPADPKSVSSIRPQLVESGGRRFLSLAFQRRAGAFLNYRVEASSDLMGWSAGDATPQTLRNRFDGSGTLQGSYLLGWPAPDKPFGFLRVRASR